MRRQHEYKQFWRDGQVLVITASVAPAMVIQRKTIVFHKVDSSALRAGIPRTPISTVSVIF